LRAGALVGFGKHFRNLEKNSTRRKHHIHSPTSMALKKITVNKNDEATFVVEQVLDAEAEEITLAIPRFSKLVESATNFRLLKREGDALGKHILIESVDDRVIELAKNAGLRCVNPFFGGGGKQFLDIVTAKREASHIASGTPSHRPEEQRGVKEAPHPRRKVPPTLSEEPLRHSPQSHKKFRVPAPRLFVALLIFISVVTLGWFLGARVLPRANIALTADRDPLSYNGNISADKGISVFDSKNLVIPGERFSEKKNIQLSFPASLKKQVSEKATGVITVFNAHSSEPQGLVKSTRFVTPEGKVYRLTESITVPGAKIEDGEIVPSSIDTKVVADKIGGDYNIGPVSKFTIPGFFGTPKAETFYGVSTGAMTGGFVGQVAYPSDADLKQAQMTIADTLRSSIHELMRAKLPKDFTVVDGAETFKILESKIDSQASTEGKFALFAEGELSFMAFREKDVVEMFSDRVKNEADGADFVVKRYAITYGKGAFNTQTKFTFPITYEAELARAIDSDVVRSKIKGRAEGELRTLIFSLPGIESAKISLWPFWVRRVPLQIEKIRITVD